MLRVYFKNYYSCCTCDTTLCSGAGGAGRGAREPGWALRLSGGARVCGLAPAGRQQHGRRARLAGPDAGAADEGRKGVVHVRRRAGPPPLHPGVVARVVPWRCCQQRATTRACLMTKASAELPRRPAEGQASCPATDGVWDTVSQVFAPPDVRLFGRRHRRGVGRVGRRGAARVALIHARAPGRTAGGRLHSERGCAVATKLHSWGLAAMPSYLHAAYCQAWPGCMKQGPWAC